MGPNESVTDYVLRAENAATRLKDAGENISDSLLIAMVLKGLPDKFGSFITIITQTDSDKMDFSKFKVSLRSYEENENARFSHSNSDNVYSFSAKC